MGQELNAPMGNAPQAAAVTDPDADANWDPANAIGYEAADPSTHADFWNESLEAGPSTRHLR